MAIVLDAVRINRSTERNPPAARARALCRRPGAGEQSVGAPFRRKPAAYVVVSEDGTKGGTDPGATQGEAVFHLVVYKAASAVA